MGFLFGGGGGGVSSAVDRREAEAAIERRKADEARTAVEEFPASAVAHFREKNGGSMALRCFIYLWYVYHICCIYINRVPTYLLVTHEQGQQEGWYNTNVPPVLAH